MRVFVAIFEDFAHNDGNPFVHTIEAAIGEKHDDIFFSSVKSDFWTDDNWDIVHVMWPDCFVPAMRNGKSLYKRLIALKKNGTKVIATIHNYWSHSHSTEEDYFFAYQIVYSLADVMVHLGECSLRHFNEIYPSAVHVIIPHHVYDHIYSVLPSKTEALTRFGLKDDIYVLAFGAFRHIEERVLMFDVIKNNPLIHFIVPRLYDIPYGKVNYRWIKQRLKKIYYKFKYPNLYCNGETFVSDEELLYYYAAANISFLPRKANLNSGNLPLGMYMGHVIVGPNIGNIGEILLNTNNYTFEFNNQKSIMDALANSVNAAKEGRGLDNREFALENWNTDKISENYYHLYKTICTNH